MFDTRQVLKWLSALATGLAAVLLGFVGTQLGAFDPATVTSDPIVAAVVAAVIAAASRGVGWLVGKLPA
jgi:hypothetical protein